MNISFVKPTAQLQPYIVCFWVFESSFGIPTNLYTYYCDHSHFIKALKRFTGFSPQ